MRGNNMSQLSFDDICELCKNYSYYMSQIIHGYQGSISQELHSSILALHIWRVEVFKII